VRLPSPGQRARKRLPRCERAAGKQQLRSSATLSSEQGVDVASSKQAAAAGDSCSSRQG